MDENFSENRELDLPTISKITDALNVSADELFRINVKHPLATHLYGNEFTEDELDEIRQFAEFIKNRKNKRYR